MLSALDLTPFFHATICIGMQRGVKFKISRINLTGVVTRLGWISRAENVFGSLISTRLILYNASGVLTNVPFFIP